MVDMTRSVGRWGKCWVFMQIASWREREKAAIRQFVRWPDTATIFERVFRVVCTILAQSLSMEVCSTFFSLYAQGSPFTTLSFPPFPFAIGWSPRTKAEFLWQIGKTVGVKFSKTSTPFSIALPFRSLFRRSHEYCKFNFGF